MPAKPTVIDLFSGVGGLSLSAVRSGFSVAAAVEKERRIYAGHFVQVGRQWFFIPAFALHLHHQRQVFANRKALKAMDPVLPADFGTAPMPGTTGKKAEA